MNRFEICKQKAIKYIGISKKTIKEVNDKLTSLKFEGEIINEVVDFLIELGYINDERYVDAYITQNIRYEKYSIKEIENKLYQKGIDINKYYKYIDILYENQYEKKVIDKLNKGKLKNMDDMSKKKYLLRRGFKGANFND